MRPSNAAVTRPDANTSTNYERVIELHPRTENVLTTLNTCFSIVRSQRGTLSTSDIPFTSVNPSGSQSRKFLCKLLG